jgi:hypothetical protein
MLLSERKIIKRQKTKDKRQKTKDKRQKNRKYMRIRYS